MNSNLFEQREILSVTELTKKIKSLLNKKFPDVWIRGEVSNYKIAASGHAYFSLKDENSVLNSVLFRGYQRDIPFDITDGLTVIAHGSIDVFERRGSYQLIVDFIEPEGIGALQLAFEQLKEQLAKEGLFDESKKKPIPTFPDTVGIVTSPTGAAIRDILNVTQRRFSGLHLIIYPTLVQGEDAAKEIVQAIRKANERNEVDVLIVGRGGGSIEDLWPFNEEIVARAIFESRIPIISAVGHEIDFTISDFVADLRAPTPSAAAELVVQNKEEILHWFKDLHTRLMNAISRCLILHRERAERYTQDLLKRLLTGILHQKQFELDDLTKSLSSSFERYMVEAKSRFEKLVGTLNALSPLDTLARGFAIVTKLPEDTPVTSTTQIDINNIVKTRLRDGEFTSIIESIKNAKG